MKTSLRTVALVVGGTLAVAACGSAGPSSSIAVPAASPSSGASFGPGPSPASRAVIIDTDLAGDDITAIAVLLGNPSLDVRAITIPGTGEVHCGPGLRNLRNLLAELGARGIPIGCGREAAGPEAYPWPDDWRAGADAGYGITFTPAPGTSAGGDAVSVIAEAVAGSPSPPLIFALGPWTNLKDALEADPGLVDRIAGIYAMGGTLDAKGNIWADGAPLEVPVEYNFGADPASVAAVLATGVPVTLVPLDATNDVPMPADILDELGADHAAAGADLVYEMYARNPFLIGEGQYLWDSLTALTLLDPTLVTWEDATVRAVTERPNAGQVARDPAGRRIRAAVGADASRTKAALLAALRRGGPRRTPFAPVGEISVTWDGAVCTISAAPSAPGLYAVRLQNGSAAPVAMLIAGVRAPKTWDDLLALVADYDPSQPQPDWVTGIAWLAAEAGNASFAFADAPAGTFGPVCLTGDDPALAITPGRPFTLGSP